MRFKHILPIEMNYTIRHFKDWCRPKLPEVDEAALKSQKRLFFLDTPAYENIGDQAIAFAMKTFMAEVLDEYSQIELTEDQLPSSIGWLKKTIRNDDIICLTGGGNMGVMYQRYESVRRLVIKTFPDNPIVIFPQTLDYGTSRYGMRELKRAVHLYGSAKKLVLCARDEESYQQMLKHFKNAKVIFCPDIVLYLDYRERFMKTDKVGICLRNDCERVLLKEQEDKLSMLFPNAETLTTIDDTSLPITWKNRKAVVEKKLEEFGSKKLILTDRLHGTIFAFITDTPCIAFPNSNGKIERVCRYLSENGNVKFQTTTDMISVKEENKNETMKFKFRELEDVVRNIAND